VKSFTPWRASRIVKALSGKPAPEMNAADMRAEPVTLSGLAGKIVLLDFWATWCEPCRDDAPALDKLQQKYGERDLAIIGISVGDRRDVVEQFLRSHPHRFPNVMANENELPRPYQVEALPTYIVIGRDGAVVAATEGNQGFSELRRILKRAGLDVD
jgi:thiol-disulfide isomerase/thioredoxin